jgi:hypothetical protein
MTHPHPDHGHEHEHEHGHQHGHRHAGVKQAEAAPPTQPVSGVMVDVGGGYGALVLHSEADRVGLEPEIHPVGVPAARQHVWVLERVTAAPGQVFAAVFPSLLAGRYAICSPAGEPTQEVDVLDGKVTEVRWDR